MSMRRVPHVLSGKRDEHSQLLIEGVALLLPYSIRERKKFHGRLLCCQLHGIKKFVAPIKQFHFHAATSYGLMTSRPLKVSWHTTIRQPNICPAKACFIHARFPHECICSE